MFFEKKKKIKELENLLSLYKNRNIDLTNDNEKLQKQLSGCETIFCENCIHGIVSYSHVCNIKDVTCDKKCQCNDFERKAE